MDVNLLSAAAFAVGTAGNLFKGVPQFVRTAIQGHVAGLSPVAVWLAFTANVLWLFFGVAIDDWHFVALSALGTAMSGGTLLRFAIRTGWATNGHLAASCAAACTSFATAGVLGHALVLEGLAWLSAW